MMFPVMPPLPRMLLDYLANRADLPAPPPDKRARICAALVLADFGDRLIDRILLLQEVRSWPLIGWLVARALDRVVGRLETITDEIERWIQKAAEA